ncbi:MAG: hypothetical protein ACREFF_10965 [Candidatus Udaeobacter sp.]
MKTFLLRNTLLILCALTVSMTRAANIRSTYIGPGEGNWGDPANWSPAVVPNNDGGDTFAVRFKDVFLTLDLDVAVNRITFAPGDSIFDGGDAPVLFCVDHDFSSLQTKVGLGGLPYFFADTKDVTADLGDLADFSGTTLDSGYAYGVAASAGRAATLKFNGANIVKSNAGIELIGAGTYIVDENGRNALRHFRHNLLYGYFDLEVGRNFTTEGCFVNEGEVVILASDPDSITGDVTTTLTIKGNYTGIGYPLDPNTNGFLTLLAAGPVGDARMVINGALTNYDANTQTLHKTIFAWEAANGASATTTVLGVSGAFDIRTSEASLLLIGPNTGFRDSSGRSALRNLATSARLILGDRDFTTKGDFTSTNRLSIYGDTQFTVNGDLIVAGGFLGLWPHTGYAAFPEPGFPLEPAYLPANLLVTGSFNLPAQSILRFHVFDANTLATMTVNGTVTLAGTLQSGVDDVSQLSQSDTITVMTAVHIVGQFSNVPSGSRVTSYVGFDIDNNPIGDPLGSFLVTYDETTLILSDFQPAEGALHQTNVPSDPEARPRRLLK